MAKNDNWRNFKIFLKENLFGLSISFWIVGFIFLLLSLGWIFYRTELEGGFESYFEATGNWNWWILIGSIIILAITTYLAWSTKKKLDEFNELIDTDSKATFVKNQEELEFLAYQLGPKFQDKVYEKKENFNIK